MAKKTALWPSRSLTSKIFYCTLSGNNPASSNLNLAALSLEAAQVDMAAVLLALDFAWQWYKFRSKDSLLENDKASQGSSVTSNHKNPVKNGKPIRSYHKSLYRESTNRQIEDKKRYAKGFDTVPSLDSAPSQFKSHRINLPPRELVLTGSKRKYSEDPIEPDSPVGCTETKTIDAKPTSIDLTSIVPTEDHASSDDLNFDLQNPIACGPNGSGYKGKVRSKGDYNAASAIFDYKGSYGELGRGKRRQIINEESGSDDLDDTAGGGGGPGPGRGPPSGEPSAVRKQKKLEKNTAKRTEKYWEWKWACVSLDWTPSWSIISANLSQCECHGHAAMDILATGFCPGCQHTRCEHCPLESAERIRHTKCAPPTSLAQFGRYHCCGYEKLHRRIHNPPRKICRSCRDAARNQGSCPID